jgi:hypothetical protein
MPDPRVLTFEPPPPPEPPKPTPIPRRPKPPEPIVIDAKVSVPAARLTVAMRSPASSS